MFRTFEHSIKLNEDFKGSDWNLYEYNEQSLVELFCNMGIMN